MVPLIAIVVVETWWLVVTMAMVIGIGIIICIQMILLLLGLLSKVMFNRVQNLYLSGVLLPY